MEIKEGERKVEREGKEGKKGGTDGKKGREVKVKRSRLYYYQRGSRKEKNG